MRILVITAAVAVSFAAVADAKTFKLTDSGHSVTVKQGKTFKVRLSEASDGGYRWVTKRKPKHGVLKLVKTKRTNSCHPPYCVGGTSTFIATYKAVGTGKAKINLVERRSFDKKHPAAKFKLRVKVS